MDAAGSSTAEIAGGTLRTFDGPPSRYRDYRAEQLRIEAATRKNQAREHERLEAAAGRMKAWAGQNEKLHRRAKAMERRVERYETQMLGEAEREARTTRFQFPCSESGDIVLQAEGLSKSFGGRTLFEDVAFTLRQGERIALVGPNGAGKTSFLKVMLGDAPSDDPAALLRYGARVRVGYYDQELRDVDPERTLIEEMIRLVGDVEAHNLLGRFLFPYEAQYKRISDLSGGERARLALLKLTLGEYNFLVLDEPTNHLDVEMIEALESALNAFEGTLLIVSHDRRFIRETTERVWELRAGRFTAFDGPWDYYQRKRQTEAQAEATPVSESPSEKEPKAKGPSKWQLERDLEGLEEQIETLEAQLATIGDQLSQSAGLEPEKIGELGEAHARLEAELLEAMAAWEETTEKLSVKS